MPTILKQVLFTPRNSPWIAACVVPRDQRTAIRLGIIISHYTFTTSHGQRRVLGYRVAREVQRRCPETVVVSGADREGESRAWFLDAAPCAEDERRPL
jgi:hypothetical protein